MSAPLPAAERAARGVYSYFKMPLRPPLDTSRRFWIGLYASYPALGTSRKVHQTFRPTHSGVEDNALWNEDRSAYGWFVCVLASGQRPAPDDEKQEQMSSRKRITQEGSAVSGAFIPAAYDQGLVFLVFCKHA